MFVFFFNDTATTEIYTLSLHDALPIFQHQERMLDQKGTQLGDVRLALTQLDQQRLDVGGRRVRGRARSEEHTSELQSRQYLVCRLLLEKKKQHHLLHLI